MVNKSRIIKWMLIVLAIALILFMIIAFFLWRRSAPQPAVTPTPTAGEQPAQYVPQPPPVFNPEAATLYVSKDALDAQQAVVQQTQSVQLLARSFAERFGSFSNQGNYQNFLDIAAFTTPKMNTWMTGYRDQLMKDHPVAGAYYAFDTKIISEELTQADDTHVTMLFTTQRRAYTEANLSPEPYYQDLSLSLVKQGDTWLVEGAFWR